MTRYSIDDYTKVIFDNTYVMSEPIRSIIRELATSLNIPTGSISNINNKNRDRDRDRYHKEKDTKNESWETIRTFKSTVIEKKEGVHKTISDIRSCLNKMSNKNYDKNKELIIQYIETDEGNIKTIAQAIFDIASTNKFFSDVYAELYRELYSKYDAFREILEDFLSKYVENMNNIHYVSPNDNYDDFSAYNKKNDARKATSTFITNLAKKQVLEHTFIIQLICQINNIIFDYIEQLDKTYELDEIVENFYILVTESIVLQENSPEWSNIIDSIRQITGYKSKEKPSLSTRAIFKCMDILDIEKKNKSK
jgi:hypothetical protein